MTTTALTCVVVVGHVDHGKSTLIGRLLFDTKNLSEDRLDDVKKTSEKLGRPFEFAHVMDQFQEEREDMMTMDTTQVFLSIDQRPFLIIDAPGHREYLKHMITGTAQAQHAIIMLDAGEGVREQTEAHAQIIKILGIHRLAVLVNKMDKLEYQEKLYLDYKNDIEQLLKDYGLKADEIIPVAAYHGDNIAARSTNMPWYQGPTTLEFLASCQPVFSALSDQALRFPVQLVHEAQERMFALGRVECGVLKEKEDIYIFPSGHRDRIKTIETYEERHVSAEPGASVALTFDSSYEPKRGDVICDKKSAVKQALEFSADSFWSDSTPLKRGDQIRVECCTQSVICEVMDLADPFDQKPRYELKEGDVGTIHWRAKTGILLEEGDHPLSRIVYHHDQELKGCGVVKKISR